MTTFALDTNIISFILRGDIVASDRLKRENDCGNAFIIPPLVYYEIRRGLLADNAKKLIQPFVDFCEEISIGEMTLEVYDEAARHYDSRRRIGRPVGDMDVLIAAFCIVNGYTLVTHNTKHFDDIAELDCVDWKK
jgi:predicted nucleic acid-binding protein